jgi:hypothetical protein
MLLVKVLNVMVMLGVTMAVPKKLEDPNVSRSRIVKSGRRTKSEST